MSYTAALYLTDLKGELSALILTGTTDGKGRPRWTVHGNPALELVRSWEFLIEEYYNAGLHGTGSLGEVRDMVFAMTRIAEEFDLKLSVPPETQEKIDAEVKAEAEALPLGAVN